MAEPTKQTAKPANSGVFDITKPGKSTPSANSKNIIITNRPVLKDPMMAAEPSTAEAAPAPSTPASGGKLIAPLQPVAVPAPAATDEPKAEEKPTSPPPAAEPPKQPEPTNDAEEPASDEPEKTGIKDPKTEASDEAAAKAAAEQEAALQKLVESRKYYLPINQVEKRRNKRVAILGVLLIILLGLAWADISLDAGLIAIPGIKPPTHFFK